MRSLQASRGFSLVELAIALGIVGLLTFGLFRLMMSGGQETENQAAAAQQLQVVKAVQSLIAANLSSGINVNAKPDNTPFALTWSGGASGQNVADYLPTGFQQTNVFGHQFNVVVRPGTTLGGSPRRVDFAVVTSGGTGTISDTRGGRIAAAMGAEGGFVPVASSTNVLGAFGGYSVPVGTFTSGGIGPVVSHPVAVSTYGNDRFANSFLNRFQVNADPDPLNTMSAKLYMGGNAIEMSPNIGSPTTGGGSLNMAGGNITNFAAISAAATTSTLNMGGGTIAMGGGAINTVQTVSMNSGGTINTNAGIINNLVTLNLNTSGVINMNSGTLNAQSGTIYAGQFIYSTSDRRIKDHIVPVERALSRLLDLQGVSYTMKSGGQKNLGVIAQDVEKVFPELVTTGQDGIKMVSYNGLIAPLIEAVRQLKTDNDALQAKLADQDKRLKALEAVKKPTPKQP
jgi:prepilin-type N-terminal cleavage/methylation domain-containing protein